MKEGYTIVFWPDSMLLEEFDWFDECEVVEGKHNILNLGFLRYWVPNERMKELKEKKDE